MKPSIDQAKVSVQSPSELVATVPHLVGFHPSESLVILCLDGPRNRVGFVMRVDLPDPDQAERFTAEMTARVAKENAAGVLLLSYTALPDAGGELPGRDLVEALMDELLLGGIVTLDALLVRDGRWWSYTCAKPCCPRTGTPVPDSNEARLTGIEAMRVLTGSAVLPGRQALVRSVAGPADERLAAIRRRIDEESPAYVERLMSGGVEAARRHTLDVAHGIFREFVGGRREIDDQSAARILLALEDRWVRDVLITWSVDEQGQQLLAFLIALAQCAPDEHAAPVCTVLAAVAYQHGRGALAAVALERALRHEPDYQLARILDALLVGQVNPREIRELARKARRALGQERTGDGGDAGHGSSTDIVG